MSFQKIGACFALGLSLFFFSSLSFAHESHSEESHLQSVQNNPEPLRYCEEDWQCDSGQRCIRNRCEGEAAGRWTCVAEASWGEDHDFVHSGVGNTRRQARQGALSRCWDFHNSCEIAYCYRN